MLSTGTGTLAGLICRRALQQPARRWLRFEDPSGSVEEFTWRRSARISQEIAGALADLGVGPGDAVHVNLTNCPEFVHVWFATALLGAVMVPSNPASAADELAYVLEHSGAKVSIAGAEGSERLTEAARATGLRHVLLTDGEADDGASASLRAACEAASSPPTPRLSPESPAAILYTSGTTARPKGVVVTHGNYLYAGIVMAASVRLARQDRHLVVLPLFHANAQYYSFMSALVADASVALMARFSASRWAEQASEHAATVASLFAAPIRMILARGGAAPPNRLRCIWYAQNVSDRQFDDFEARFGAPLVQLYGMTETIGAPLMAPLDGPRKRRSVGLPTLGYAVRLVDEDGQDLAPNQTGELLVRGCPGETIMAGYLHDDEATAAAITGSWLHTGDIFTFDEDGHFFFVDRRKDLIKRSGENVSAGEVERVLAEHPAVAETAVVGSPDDWRDERVVAFVVLADEHVTPGELMQHCTDRLARFKVPDQIVVTGALPRTPVGKIQKHLLAVPDP